ncbi:hypothetical protein, partial [Pseudaminobacter soli (ex Li et al. 2025)]
VYCLNEAANLVDESTDAEVAETLVEAIGAIQAAQTLLMERPADDFTGDISFELQYRPRAQ